MGVNVPQLDTFPTREYVQEHSYLGEAVMVRVQYGPVWKEYSKGLTNRRYLLILGALMTVVGVAGFFLGTNPDDLYHLDTGQNIAYLVLGSVALLAGEVWTSGWKRILLGMEGVLITAVGIAGFIVAGGGTGDLGVFSVSLWENVAHVVFGAIALATIFYPRHFRDYSYGTAVSD